MKQTGKPDWCSGDCLGVGGVSEAGEGEGEAEQSRAGGHGGDCSLAEWRHLLYTTPPPVQPPHLTALTTPHRSTQPEV